MKCKTRHAEAAARQREPMCRTCLYAGLLNRFGKAVRMQGLVQKGDRVLVCVSGGIGSMSLLHFLSQLHNPHPDRLVSGKVHFELSVIHIEEGFAHGLSPEASAAAAEAVRAAVAACNPSAAFYCIPLDAVFAAHEQPAAALEASLAAQGPEPRSLHDWQRFVPRLQELLEAVTDPTGREDLIEHLREALLLTTAARLGCNRLAKGDCATRLAVRTVALSSKGCGFALPGCLQYVDARHGPQQPVSISPIRDLAVKELALMCHYQRVSLAPLPVLRRSPKASINALAEAFVANLQATVPSSVSTIVKTALKLQAFPWNAGLPVHNRRPAKESAPVDRPAAAQPAEPASSSGRPNSGANAFRLCAVCAAPMMLNELAGTATTQAVDQAGASTSGPLAQACCRSCRGQIMTQLAV
ncbi:hypothetical protein WJX72_004896 [[Myrmecia] bisecta]|uniref:Cytoplasmic tRNA 2-thiolation protein 2 n=1 Tax=[Myrmecia] bisecta TaxID=41462 RepID=A0AAW1PRS9_9CHLO